MTSLDHAYALLIGIAFPVLSFVSYRRLLQRVAAGQVVNRPQMYRHTILIQMALLALAIALWAESGRSWTALGFGLQLDLHFALAVALTVAGVAALILQLRQTMTASQDEIDSIKSQIGDMSILIPKTGGELARFYGLSITAGIVEEVLWRGFVIWYLSQFMPLWAAAVVSTIGFGLAHAYQGISHLPQVTLVGAAFAALFLLSGSLWLPMVLHAAVDILQGRLAYAVFKYNGAGDCPAATVTGVSVSSHK